LSAQPHDWASHLDHVPVLDDPEPRFKRPRFSFSLLRQQRTAMRDAWSVLDHLRDGTLTRDVLPTARPRAKRGQFWRQLRHLPPRVIGHITLLVLFFGVLASGGLPSLALGMDWSQGTQLATDHVAFELPQEALQIGVNVPFVIDAPGTTEGAISADEARDSLVPSLLPQPMAASSPFAAVHVVAPGETLGTIAAQYGVSAQSILASNPIDAKMLGIRQELRIPRVVGVPHTVAEGETVESIATTFNVPSSNIRFFPANRLGNGRPLQAGEEIFVPGAATVATPEADAATIAAIPIASVLDNETRIRTGPGTAYDRIAQLAANTRVALTGRHENWFRIRTVNGTEGWIAAELLGVADGVADNVAVVADIPALPQPTVVAQVEKKAAPAAARVAPSNRWVWPAAGDLTSGFGYRNMRVGSFHNGIDIANRKNTPIRAARGGKVIAAGWCSGYGYCVKINHGDGFVTEYGHLSSQPNVRAGQYVNAGDRIGLMGSTYDRKGGGYATGVHLHFTVKLNGKAVNPMRYLP
jgi:murein DD-endopeptidase MepM/ murein hydrolase activator NlpD